VLQAGDSWEWDRTVSDHTPTDGWALAYLLVGGPVGTAPVAISSTPSGDTYQVRVAASATEDVPAGIYSLIGRVSKGTDRYTVHKSTVTVEPDPATDTRSHAEKMCAKIEAELEARTATAGSTVRSWSQGGRSEEYSDEQELRRQLGYYRDQVRMERTGSPFVHVKSEFVS
jgi:flagellar capping protein FliD